MSNADIRDERAVGRFTSEAAERRFLAAYDAAMGLWPTPREELDVDTAAGTTHVHRYGPDDGVPFVLLHGAAGNSSMWFPNVGAFGGRNPVYAVDTPGDPGRSRQRRSIHAPGAAASWLDDVLAGLGIESAHLVGSSYGGWLALNQAVRASARVASVTLADPGGLERVGARFYLWLVVNGLAGLLPRPLRIGAAATLSNPVLVNPELRRCTLLGARGYRISRPAPEPLTDDELCAIRVPALFLLGERSPLLRVARARARVEELLPHAVVEVMPGTTHGPSIERPDKFHDRVLGFVAATA